MARRHEKTITGKIFENILFLEEVFGDKEDADIPDVPVLELAKCFELSHPRILRANQRTSKVLGALEIERVNYRITEVNDWVIVHPSGKAQNNEPYTGEISFPSVAHPKRYPGYRQSERNLASRSVGNGTPHFLQKGGGSTSRNSPPLQLESLPARLFSKRPLCRTVRDLR